MATYSSILAWKIPWTEEPDGLQSMGSKGARYNQQLTFPLSYNVITFIPGQSSSSD